MTETRTWDYRVAATVATRRHPDGIVDGDTFDLTVEKRMDFGFRLIETKRWSARFRLLGIDVYETNEAGGAAATSFAKAWIEGALRDDVLRGQTFKADDFGRWLIDLYRTDTGEHLRDALAAEGLAEP